MLALITSKIGAAVAVAGALLLVIGYLLIARANLKADLAASEARAASYAEAIKTQNAAVDALATLKATADSVTTNALKAADAAAAPLVSEARAILLTKPTGDACAAADALIEGVSQ